MSLRVRHASWRTRQSFIILVAFLINTFGPMPQSQAGEMVMPVMPKPGIMVNLSPAYTPAYLKGIVIHPENALKFDFLVHKGDGNLDQDQKKEEYNKLIKYFLASLTVPDKDQWVNLSPYEKNRIIADDFGKTEMGRDILGQDYLLKQITSSLMYPESGLGKNFWDKVYERAFKEYGTTDIPVNTFNKVWIVPDEALIYESGNTAYVVKSHLKVMLEEDYLALSRHSERSVQNDSHAVASKVIREIILPAIEREVNEGKNFAMLRQVFSGMLLATWYKKALKESLLGKIYADKAKLQGVELPSVKRPYGGDIVSGVIARSAVQRSEATKQSYQDLTLEHIYQQYLSAFKKGVFNYIKEDAVPIPGTPSKEQGIFPRKYFAGGVWNDAAQIAKYTPVTDEAMAAAVGADENQDLAVVVVDAAQTPIPRRTFLKRLAAKGVVIGAGLFSGRAFAQRAETEPVNVDPYVRYVTYTLGDNRKGSLNWQDYLLNPEGQILKEYELIPGRLKIEVGNMITYWTPRSGSGKILGKLVAIQKMKGHIYLYANPIDQGIPNVLDADVLVIKSPEVGQVPVDAIKRDAAMTRELPVAIAQLTGKLYEIVGRFSGGQPHERTKLLRFIKELVILKPSQVKAAAQDVPDGGQGRLV